MKRFFKNLTFAPEKLAPKCEFKKNDKKWTKNVKIQNLASFFNPKYNIKKEALPNFSKDTSLDTSCQI